MVRIVRQTSVAWLKPIPIRGARAQNVNLMPEGT